MRPAEPNAFYTVEHREAIKIFIHVPSSAVLMRHQMQDFFEK